MSAVGEVDRGGMWIHGDFTRAGWTAATIARASGDSMQNRGMSRLEVKIELPGWELVWFELEAAAIRGRRERRSPSGRGRRPRCAAAWTAAELGEDPTVAALRRLFRAAGTDPTHYRPSSEALLRRLLKGEELAPIHPLVDQNALSIELKVPACVLATGSFSFPVTLGAGRAGEILDSMRGPLDLAGKPFLADSEGPFGSPITDSHRVKVRPETRRAWLVAYLPEGGFVAGDVAARLDGILAEAPVAPARRLTPGRRRRGVVEWRRCLLSSSPAASASSCAGWPTPSSRSSTSARGALRGRPRPDRPRPRRPRADQAALRRQPGGEGGARRRDRGPPRLRRGRPGRPRSVFDRPQRDPEKRKIHLLGAEPEGRSGSES